MKKPISKKSMIVRNARKILQFLGQKKEQISPLLILPHDYPDPDSLASAVTLQYIAQQGFDIQSRVVYGGIVGRMENRAMVGILKLPVHKIKPGELKKYDHVALVDTQPLFENNPFPKNQQATLVVDQHPFVTRPDADLAIVDTECGATSVLMAQALLLLKIDIPMSVATALAYGILSDTLNLYRAARPDIVAIYLSLLPHCDMKALAKIQNPSRSRRFFRTLSKGIHQARVRWGFIVSHLGPVESPDVIAQVADFLLTYKGMRWALCTGRYKGKLHCSLRSSNPNAEASDVLRDTFVHRGQAGGHGAIAGGSFKVGENADEQQWQEAENSLTERLMKRIRISTKRQLYFPFRK